MICIDKPPITLYNMVKNENEKIMTEQEFNKWLEEKGFNNIGSKNRYNETPTQLALKEMDATVIETIAEKYPESLNSVDMNDILHIALEECSKELITYIAKKSPEILLEKNKNTRSHLNETCSPILFLAKNGNAELLEATINVIGAKKILESFPASLFDGRDVNSKTLYIFLYAVKKNMQINYKGTKESFKKAQNEIKELDTIMKSKFNDYRNSIDNYDAKYRAREESKDIAKAFKDVLKSVKEK